jgi:hypothetical protein
MIPIERRGGWRESSNIGAVRPLFLRVRKGAEGALINIHTNEVRKDAEGALINIHTMRVRKDAEGALINTRTNEGA